MDEQVLRSLSGLRDQVRAELEGHIIPFWKGLRDDGQGGYYGFMGYDLRLDKNAVKGCILNSRILWFFSNAYKLLGDAELLSCAAHAYRFLQDAFVDRENGGVYWSVRHDGAVEDATKHTYNQAFAIYGLVHYYEASGDASALDAAWRLFDVIESKCRDADGYLEAFTAKFAPASNEKLSENGVMATRTMNTLLHVFEAYTDLYRVTHDGRAKEKLHAILSQFAEKIWNAKAQRQEVFFDADFHSLIDLYSYGHDIETSWLMDHCLDVLDDPQYTALIRPITDVIARRIHAVAYRDQSLLNECERGTDNTTRVWWVQAEAVVGFFNAWQKSGEQRYLDASIAIWGYIRRYLVDARPGGEWFSEVYENHEPSQKPIVEPWKCPYHNGRMCFEIIRRTERLVQAGRA